VEIDIPSEIKAFLDEIVDSFVMWDILIYCSKMPSDFETSVRIAQLLGRKLEEIQKPVKKLEKLALIISDKRIDGDTILRLNKNSSYMAPLEKFWAYNESQENRLRILSYLLQKKVR
jgi:hypothetical protein